MGRHVLKENLTPLNPNVIERNYLFSVPLEFLHPVTGISSPQINKSETVLSRFSMDLPTILNHSSFQAVYAGCYD